MFGQLPRRARGPRAAGTVGLTLGAANRLRSSEVSGSLTHGGAVFNASASVGAASELRAGGGVDSHAAVTRFLGLPSSVIGEKLENTGYSQKARTAGALLPAGTGRHLTLSYRRGEDKPAAEPTLEAGARSGVRSTEIVVERGLRRLGQSPRLRPLRAQPAIARSRP